MGTTAKSRYLSKHEGGKGRLVLQNKEGNILSCVNLKQVSEWHTCSIFSGNSGGRGRGVTTVAVLHILKRKLSTSAPLGVPCTFATC